MKARMLRTAGRMAAIFVLLAAPILIAGCSIPGVKHQVPTAAAISPEISPTTGGITLAANTTPDLTLSPVIPATRTPIFFPSLTPTASLAPNEGVPPGRIVFVGETEDGIWDVFTANLAGSDRRDLSNNPTGINQSVPALSPDGDKVAFTSNAGGVWDVFVVNSDGSHLVRLTQGTQENQWQVLPGAWSPDGKRLAALRNAFTPENTITQELYVINLDGSGMVKIREGSIYNVHWSPGGNYIAYMSYNNAVGRDALWVINPDGTGEKLVASDLGSTMLAEVYAWLPAGQSIAYIRTSFTPNSRPEDAGRYELSLVNVENSEITILMVLLETKAKELYWFGYLAWSPDGQQLALASNYQGPIGLYLFRSDGILTCLYQEAGIEATAVPGQSARNSPSEYLHPAWSVDGQWLLFQAHDSTGVFSVYRLQIPENLQDAHLIPVKLVNGIGVDTGR